jgi:hypothetical protein
MRQNMAMPSSVRKQPETFCWTDDSCASRARPDCWIQPSTTRPPSLAEGFFTVTHPFHPLYGQQFEVLNYRHNWGEYRVTFYETPDHVRTLPATWTSLVPSDPSIVLAAGRAAFQMKDLLALTHLLQHIDQQQKEADQC